MGSAPLTRRLAAGAEVLVDLACAFPARYPMLLESAAEGAHARRSVLAAFPSASLCTARDGGLRTEGVDLGTETVKGSGEASTGGRRGFLTALEHWYELERSRGVPSHAWPGLGWVLFLGYELVSEIEPRLRLPAAELPFNAYALRTRAALVYDHHAETLTAVAEDDAARELEALCADVARAAGERKHHGPRAKRETLVVDEEPPALFIERVRRAQAYIRAGDVYQVNLSRSWRARRPARVAVETLYRRLRETNPAPFAALAQWRDVAILSSSPERLVKVSAGMVETCPIAGTRPRDAARVDDLRERAELIAHPKERAEHVMLVDLERNDLGRVCEAGSVRVEELMRLESYAHVHHIVSIVRGRLRADVTPIGVIRAVFPGGTITGCPKFRCMQIIGELERGGRGAYTGSLGYLTTSGEMDLNILIRTMTVAQDAVELRAGAGIVADSDPERELEETRAKARGLLAALS